MKKQLFCVFLACASLLLSATLAAAPGDLVTRFDVVVDSFELDQQSNNLYASLPESNSVAIIDGNIPEVTAIIPVGSRPLGIALSRDRNKLYVATSGATKLEVIDLATQSRLTPYQLPFAPGDVAVDARGRIYTVPAGTNDRDMAIIHPDSGEVEQVRCNNCYQGMLEMSPDGNTLYLANQGLSPGSVEKLDVSGDGAPVSIWKNEHGSLGSNGQDLWLTPDGRHLYYATGGGNRITGGYDIGQIDTSNMAINGAFVTGAYPREITTSPDGKTAYAVHTSGHIDVWDAQTYLQVTEYPTSGEASELITDRSGQFLFSGFSDGLRVYEAQGGEGPSQCELDLNTLQDEVLALVDTAESQADTIEHLQETNSELSSRVNELESALSADADGDGVLDVADECPDTREGDRTDSNGCSWRQTSGGWWSQF